MRTPCTPRRGQPCPLPVPSSYPRCAGAGGWRARAGPAGTGPASAGRRLCEPQLPQVVSARGRRGGGAAAGNNVARSQHPLPLSPAPLTRTPPPSTCQSRHLPPHPPTHTPPPPPPPPRLCAPRGSAVLWVHPRHRARLHPLVVSHGHGSGFSSEVGWGGRQRVCVCACVRACARVHVCVCVCWGVLGGGGAV